MRYDLVRYDLMRYDLVKASLVSRMCKLVDMEMEEFWVGINASAFSEFGVRSAAGLLTM